MTSSLDRRTEGQQRTDAVALPILTSVFMASLDATRSRQRISPTLALIRYGNNSSFLDHVARAATPMIDEQTGIRLHPDDAAQIFLSAKTQTETAVSDALQQPNYTPVRLRPTPQATRGMNKYELAEHLKLRMSQLVTQTLTDGELYAPIGILDVYPVQAPKIEYVTISFAGYDPLLFLVNPRRAARAGVNPGIFEIFNAAMRTAVRTSLLTLHDYDTQQAMEHILINSPHLLPYNKSDQLRDRARILKTCGRAVSETFDDFAGIASRFASRGRPFMQAPSLVVAAETLGSFWHGLGPDGRPLGQPFQMQTVLENLDRLSRGK